MRLTHNDLPLLLPQINNSFKKASFKEIIPLELDAYALCFEGKKEQLLISFHQELLLLCLTELHYKQAAKQDRYWLFAINQKLKGSTLLETKQIADDCIISMLFQDEKEGCLYELIAQLIPGKKALLLVESTHRNIFASSTSAYTKEQAYQEPKASPHEPLKNDLWSSHKLEGSHELAQYYHKARAGLLLSELKSKEMKSLTKEVKRLTKSIAQNKTDLEKAVSSHLVEQQAQLIIAHLWCWHKEKNELTITNWFKEGQEETISWPAGLTAQEHAKRLFTKAKKLKRSTEHLLERQYLLEDKLQKTQKKLEELQKIDTLSGWQQWSHKEPQKNKNKPSSPQEKKRHLYRLFTSKNGHQIRVGRGAKENHQLTFHLSNGNDLWLHIADYGGAHVIIVSKKGVDQVEEETILDAAQLALYYSQAKEKGEAEVLITQCKWLKPVKGKVGQVLISHAKRRRVKRDEERLQRLHPPS